MHLYTHKVKTHSLAPGTLIFQALGQVGTKKQPRLTLRGHNDFNRHIVADLLNARRMRQHRLGLQRALI